MAHPKASDPLVEQIQLRCRAQGLPAPDRRTITARVLDIEARVRAAHRGEARTLKTATATPGVYNAARPLEIVQVDHTQVDVVVVDEETRKPHDGRPWLTLAVDVFTRMVTGFHLSMDPPSRLSISLCLLHAVYDKTAWLQER